MHYRQRSGGIISRGLRTFQRETPSRGTVPPPTAIHSLTIQCWAHLFKLKNSACPPTGVSGTRVAEIRSRFGVGCLKRMQMAENNTGPSLGAVWDGVTQRRVRAAGVYRGSKGTPGVYPTSHSACRRPIGSAEPRSCMKRRIAFPPPCSTSSFYLSNQRANAGLLGQIHGLLH